MNIGKSVENTRGGGTSHRRQRRDSSAGFDGNETLKADSRENTRGFQLSPTPNHKLAYVV